MRALSLVMALLVACLGVVAAEEQPATASTVAAATGAMIGVLTGLSHGGQNFAAAVLPVESALTTFVTWGILTGAYLELTAEACPAGSEHVRTGQHQGDKWVDDVRHPGWKTLACVPQGYVASKQAPRHATLPQRPVWKLARLSAPGTGWLGL